MIIAKQTIMKFRCCSIIIAIALGVESYVNAHQSLMLAFPLIQFFIAWILLSLIKKHCFKKVLKISRAVLLFVCMVYFIGLLLGGYVSSISSGFSEKFFSLLIYISCVDVAIGLILIVSFAENSKWKRVSCTSGYGSNPADSAMVRPYDDSVLSAYGFDSNSYWHQSPHYTTASIDSSPAVNPASGLIMVDDAIDVAGNFYGFNDHSFSNDSSQTNQFSDYDYHNNN